MNNYFFVAAVICSFLITLVASPFTLTNSGPRPEIWASSVQENTTIINVTSSDRNNDTAPPIHENINSLNTTSHVSSLDEDNITSIADIAYNNRSYLPAGVLQMPYTGLVLDQITPEISTMLSLNGSKYGLIVSEIVPDGPAADAGFYAGNITRSVGGKIIRLGGDVILGIDRNATYVRSFDAYLQYLQSEKRVGENLTLTVLRNGEFKELNLTIGALPEFFWYDNPDESIKIALPSDWEVSEKNLKKDDIVKFFSPEENPSNGLPTVGVFLKILPAGEFGLDTLARQETQERPKIRNLHVTFSDLGGFPAYESVFYNYADENRTLKMLSVFTIKDGKQIYRINFAADPWKYDEYLPIVRKMIDSFQFLTIS